MLVFERRRQLFVDVAVILLLATTTTSTAAAAAVSRPRITGVDMNDGATPRTQQTTFLRSSSSSSFATTRTTTKQPPPSSLLWNNNEQQEPQSRRAQQSDADSEFIYRANYTAQVQVVADPLCVSEPPMVHVSCFGPNIRILNDTLSNGNINCSEPALDADGWTTIQCTPLCNDNDDACMTSTYLAVAVNIDDGPFMAINFECLGNEFSAVIGAMTLAKSEGACIAAAGSSQQQSVQSRLYHVGRLGVSCPSTSTSEDNSMTSQNNASSYYYDFDDYFFECSGGSTIRGDLTPSSSSSSSTNSTTTDSIIEPDVQICISGGDCAGAACTRPLNTIIINANYLHFQDTCIIPPIPLPETPAPTPTALVLGPVPPPSPPVDDGTGDTLFTFTTQFEASWGLLFDPLQGDDCTGSTPTIRISCPTSDDIQMINNATSTSGSTAVNNPTMNCTRVSRGVMDCIDTNDTHFVDQFTSVIYQCSGSTLPITTVEYVEQMAFCNGNTLSAVVRHAIQLGVICNFDEEYGVSNGYAPYYIDGLVECGDEHNQFDYLDQFGMMNKDVRFTCLETAVFPAGSTTNETQFVPLVSVTTDPRWLRVPQSECFNMSKTLRTQAPVAPQAPTDPPTRIPTAAPVAVAAPMSSPSNNGTNSGPAAPSLAGQAQPPVAAPTKTTQSSGFVLGLAVGGASIAIVFAGMIVFLVMRYRQTAANNRKSANAKKGSTSTNTKGQHNGTYPNPVNDDSRSATEQGSAQASSSADTGPHYHAPPPPQRQHVDYVVATPYHAAGVGVVSLASTHPPSQRSAGSSGKDFGSNDSPQRVLLPPRDEELQLVQAEPSSNYSGESNRIHVVDEGSGTRPQAIAPIMPLDGKMSLISAQTPSGRSTSKDMSSVTQSISMQRMPLVSAEPTSTISGLSAPQDDGSSQRYTTSEEATRSSSSKDVSAISPDGRSMSVQDMPMVPVEPTSVLSSGVASSVGNNSSSNNSVPVSDESTDAMTAIVKPMESEAPSVMDTATSNDDAVDDTTTTTTAAAEPSMESPTPVVMNAVSIGTGTTTRGADPPEEGRYQL